MSNLNYCPWDDERGIEEFCEKYNGQSGKNFKPVLCDFFFPRNFKQDDFVLWAEKETIQAYIHGAFFRVGNSNDFKAAIYAYLGDELQHNTINFNVAFEFPRNVVYIKQMESFEKGCGKMLIQYLERFQHDSIVLWPNEGHDWLTTYYKEIGFSELGIYLGRKHIPVLIKNK